MYSSDPKSSYRANTEHIEPQEGEAMIIAVAMQKGGTGKTATAAALAQAAAHDGKGVLCIDLDPQGDFTFAMGAKMTGTGALDFLAGSTAHAIHTTAPNIDIVPASADLATLASDKGTARRLQKALEPVKDRYDYIFIDTPPTAGELQYNALQAAEGVIIPLVADAYSLQSLFLIANTVKTVQLSNKALQPLGVIFTQFNGRTSLAKQMRQTITEEAQKMGLPILGTIRAGVAIGEAAALQQSLYDYAPKSKPALDYMTIYEKIRG